MKKQFIRYSMFLMLSLVTSTLFAQASARIDIEAKLAANGKSWIWYKSDPKSSSDKDQTYTFNKTTHKVSISSGGTQTSKKWTITTPPGDGQATLTIGTDSYLLSFGSDQTHNEFMMLKAGRPVITNYYYSVVTR